MTLLSNHRVHSYKATAANYRRDLSPKKVPLLRTNTPSKRVRTPSPKTRDHFTRLLKIVQTHTDIPVTPPSSPQLMASPTPSAPPAIMTLRTIHVWNNVYNVLIPQDFDIYEGLRMFYPNLYTEVLKEDNYYRENQDIHHTDNSYNEITTDEDIEAAWAHYDYLEYLCDF
jgi:hypothetical protein